MSPWLMIGCGWLAMALVMTICWLIQRRTHDAGIVDAAWTFGVGLLAVAFCWGSDGDLSRRIVVALLSLAWSLRLGGYIVYRLATLPEDGRYQQLKQQWGTNAQTRLFFFYQFQALGAVLFALPMLLAAQNSQPWGIADYCGLGIWLFAIAGEAIADQQLAHFRASSQNRGQVCRIGLWNYSRHPNYFFEWLHWWAYVLLASGASWGWLSIFAPLAMLYFITQVTGIPPTEAQAVRSRGDAYREYQRTTSPFFPWPPKQSSAN